MSNSEKLAQDLASHEKVCAKNHQEVIGRLGVVERDVSELKGGVRKLESDMAGVKSDIAGMKSDMEGMKSDMEGMKSDIAGVKSDMEGMKSDMAGMRVDLLWVKRLMWFVAVLYAANSVSLPAKILKFVAVVMQGLFT